MLVTVYAQSGLLLLEHTHAVEHATVNDSLVEVTPLFDKSLLQMVNVSIVVFNKLQVPSLHLR